MNAATSPPLLQLESINLAIGGHWLLRDINLAFQPGTLTTLLGPNGAGKSTLLGVAAGDLVPSHGDVRLHGRPIRDWRAKALARERAVMPQDHSVRFAFSVREVIAMGRLPHLPDPARDTQIIQASMHAADITHLAERDVQTLSGGESARTAFARVLAQETKLLLLDEPTAALDMQHQETTLRRLRELRLAGACVIVVLHDLNLAAAYSDRIVILEQGRLAADGCPHEVLTEATISRIYRQSVRVIDHPTRPVPLVVLTD